MAVLEEPLKGTLAVKNYINGEMEIKFLREECT
jgi:hypothetical protein